MSAPIPPIGGALIKKVVKKIKAPVPAKMEKMQPKLAPRPRTQRAAETAAMNKFNVSSHVGTTTADSLKKRQDATAGAIRKNANGRPGY